MKIIEFLRIQVYMVNLDIADDLRRWFLAGFASQLRISNTAQTFALKSNTDIINIIKICIAPPIC